MKVGAVDRGNAGAVSGLRDQSPGAGIVVPELQLACFGDGEQSAIGIDDFVDPILIDDQT
jgi:hypothetical protein